MEKNEQNDRKEQLRHSIENSQAGYFFIDLSGHYRDVNRSWLRMHKYDHPEDVIGKHFSLTQIDADQEKAQKTVDILLSGKPVPSGEFSRLCKDGTVGYHTFSANPVYSGCELVGLEGFLIDITEKKKVEENLRETDLLLRTVLGNAPITIYATDKNGIFTLSEGRGLENVGLKPGENVGLSALDMYASFPFTKESGELIPGKDLILRVLTGESITVGSELHGCHFENYLGPIRDAEGEITGLVGVAIDITGRKRAEEKILEQLSELKRWQQVMIGREDRVRELKQEVNDLCSQVNEPVRYPSQEGDTT